MFIFIFFRNRSGMKQSLQTAVRWKLVCNFLIYLYIYLGLSQEYHLC